MATSLSPEEVKSLPKKIKKVGVFVNATTNYIQQVASDYALDILQLHGQEPPQQCAQLKEQGYLITKVFSIGHDTFDFNQLEPYKPLVDYFLFDTQGQQLGGNGVAFDWSKLRQYDNEIPFFLSGGISLDNIEQLKALKHLNLHAVDVNSRFEIEPGLKDIDQLKLLIQKLS